MFLEDLNRTREFLGGWFARSFSFESLKTQKAKPVRIEVERKADQIPKLVERLVVVQSIAPRLDLKMDSPSAFQPSGGSSCMYLFCVFSRSGRSSDWFSLRP